MNYIIAGGSSGIGGGITKKLSDLGHRVQVMSRNSSGIDQLSNIEWHNLDFTADEITFPTIDEPVHGIAYCVGSINLKPFRSFKKQDYLLDWQLNFMGAVQLLQAYQKNLQAAGNASVLLFSTVAVQTGMPYHSSIASAKGAVEGLVKALAAEWAPNIRVNAIAPSLTQTPLASKLLSSEEKIQQAKDRHPLKDIGTVDKIVPMAVQLLNAEENWITGQIIHIDGGMSTLKV